MEIDTRFALITKDNVRLYPYMKSQKKTNRFGYALTKPGDADRNGGGDYTDDLKTVIQKLVFENWNVRAKTIGTNKGLDGTYGIGKIAIIGYEISEDLEHLVSHAETKPIRNLDGKSKPASSLGGKSVAECAETTDGVTIDEYIDATNEIDKKVEVLVRTEQAFLRKELFNSHDIATCCICNSIMPIKFLVTAHIKKRSLCTDAEKRDYKNIVTPMCKFGCDELYERGFIAVHGGHVINIKTPSDDYGHDYINEYLKKITGQKCNTYTPKSSGYFEWHYDKHKLGVDKQVRYYSEK